MKALILGAGNAKRLKPISEFIPKPLIPIMGVPLINYIISQLPHEIEEINLVIRKEHYPYFKYWLNTNKEFLDNKEVNFKYGTGRGAIYDLYRGLVGEEDDLLILAGDNLFNFNLEDLVSFGKAKDSITLALYKSNDLDLIRRTSLVEIDETNRIKSFIEKPANPKPGYISTAIYYFPKSKLYLVDEYLNSNQENDNLGKLFEWVLSKGIPIYGVKFDGLWLDVGTIDSYREANRIIRELKLYEKFI